MLLAVPTTFAYARNDLVNGKSPPQQETITTTPETCAIEIAASFTPITIAETDVGLGEGASYIMTSEENPVATCQSIEVATTTSRPSNTESTMTTIIRDQEYFLGPGLCIRLGKTAERAQLSNTYDEMIATRLNADQAKHIRGPGLILVPAGCGGRLDSLHQNNDAEIIAHNGQAILGPGYKSI